MKAGLVWRGFPKDSHLEKYIKKIVGALAGAGHIPVVYTSRNSPACGFTNAEIRILTPTRPRAFANAFTALSSRNEYGFLLSTELIRDCDCYLALNGVHRTQVEQWKKTEPFPWRWLRSVGCNSAELLALEEKAFLSGFAKHVVVGSKMVKEEIIRHFDFPSSRIEVVYEGITPPVGDRAALRDKARRKLGLAAEDYVVFCGGPGLHESEYRFAIEGINRTNLSQPVLLVSCRENHWAYPRSRRTRFVGEKLDTAELIAAADVFLLPAVYNPFSKTCLEALAAGLPVITTRTNGFSEIIEPGVEGEVLQEPSDVEAIARAIESWSNPDKRHAIKPRLSKIAAQFDPAGSIQAVLAQLDYCETT